MTLKVVTIPLVFNVKIEKFLYLSIKFYFHQFENFNFLALVIFTIEVRL